MRYDTPVFFRRIVQGEYDCETGDYGPDRFKEEKRYASIMNPGTNTLNLVYGGIRQGSQIVQIQNHYDAGFDQIRIGTRLYRVDFSRRLLTKHVFIVSEVQ